jgi:hypothetical protein
VAPDRTFLQPFATREAAVASKKAVLKGRHGVGDDRVFLWRVKWEDMLCTSCKTVSTVVAAWIAEMDGIEEHDNTTTVFISDMQGIHQVWPCRVVSLMGRSTRDST